MVAKYTLLVWTRQIYTRDYIYEGVYQGNSLWALGLAMWKHRKQRQRIEIVSKKETY